MTDKSAGRQRRAGPDSGKEDGAVQLCRKWRGKGGETSHRRKAQRLE